MNSVEEFRNIIDVYSQAFKLDQVYESNEIRLYLDDVLVGKISVDDPAVFEYKEGERWRKCKTSDLVLLILEQCSLHGGEDVLRL